jgi:hypothetical protein
MNIETLTIGEAREIARLFNTAAVPTPRVTPYVIGSPYFIRTVTFHYTGRLVMVTDQELVLEDAAWIADSGRFADALKTGEYEEVEPYPDGKRIIIGRAMVVDAVQVESTTRSQK